MASRADFTDKEWWRLTEAPLAAALYVASADVRTGPIGTIKELDAPFKAATEQLNTAGASGLLGELLLAWSNKLAADDQQAAHAGADESVGASDTDLLGFLREVGRLLDAKAAPDEARAVKAWLVAAAQGSAEAGKEGAVLGIGGERVSGAETKAVAEIALALGATA